MAAPEWITDYKDLAVAMGWLVTMSGWFVSNGSANKREKRKEARTEIDACAKMAYEVLSLCREYLSSDPGADTCSLLAAKIRFELQRLFLRVERIEKKYPQFELCNAAGELLDSATGGDFDSSTRKPLELNDPVLLKIEADVHHLIDELEEGFSRAF